MAVTHMKFARLIAIAWTSSTGGAGADRRVDWPAEVFDNISVRTDHTVPEPNRVKIIARRPTEPDVRERNENSHHH